MSCRTFSAVSTASGLLADMQQMLASKGASARQMKLMERQALLDSARRARVSGYISMAMLDDMANYWDVLERALEVQ